MGEPAEMSIEFDNGPAVFQEEGESPSPKPEVTDKTEGDDSPPESQDGDPDPKAKPDEVDLQKKIAEKAYKLRVAEREAEALRKRVEALEQASGKQAKPEVPAMPDPLSMTDEQFRQFQAQRDEAIRQQAAWEAQQTAVRQQREALEVESQKRQEEELAKAGQEYAARATQLGVKPEELQQAGKMVWDYGIPKEIAELIIHDDQGPLMTKYLAANIAELDELVKMPLTRAAIYLDRVVKQKASSLKPRVSNAPDPVDAPRGGNASISNIGPKGATFE